ncbi:hypothetical protein D3C80_700540 [compost metagenome]
MVSANEGMIDAKGSVGYLTVRDMTGQVFPIGGCGFPESSDIRQRKLHLRIDRGRRCDKIQERIAQPGIALGAGETGFQRRS